MSFKKILKFIGIAIVIGLFIGIFKNTNFKDLWYYIKHIPVSTMVLLIILQIITQLLLSLQWHRITGAISGISKFTKMFYIMSTGTVIEAVTPGAKIGGEVTRLYYLKKELGLKTEKATSVIIIQKCISMSVLFSICVVSFAYLSFQAFAVEEIGFIVIFLAGLSVVLLLLMLFYPNKIIKMLGKSDSKFDNKIRSMLEKYNESLELISKKEWIFQFGISFLVWILFPIKAIILANSLNLGINFLVMLAITMTSYMVGMLPLSPGGVGTFEGTMISLLAVVPIENALSITVSIVFRVITFWFVIFMSGIYVIMYKRRLKSNDK